MLQYLVILLDDTSVSYCHCDNPYKKRRLISLDDLRAGILYAMKENLMIQFVYPDYELPQDYLDVIDTIDHHDIVPSPMKGDVVVLGTYPATSWHPSVDIPRPNGHPSQEGTGMADAVIVVRLTKKELFANGETIAEMIPKVKRLNIVITDLETFTDEDIKEYEQVLDRLANMLKAEYLGGHTPQLNLLTDRMMLTHPNHCNAGVENITLAPNGRFYICPAFYYSDPNDSIDPQNIPNQQLLRLDHAPLCRHCDAYHCRRCVWLNRKTTLEVNTPSHEQCIVAHTERNAARKLLSAIREQATFMPEVEIKEINYTDPFEVRKEW